jgi:hypothetical protein
VLPTGGSFDVDPHAHAPEARLRELDRNGLERAVVSLPPTMEPTDELVELWHADAVELERLTDGRLVPLAYECADPAFAGAIVAAPSLGRSLTLLTRLEWQAQLLFVHPGPSLPSIPSWRTAGVDYTQQQLDAFAGWLASGVRRWPNLRVVFALLGGGAAFQLERFVRRGLDPRAALGDVWLESSSYGERALELSLQTFGANRVLFGSDAPVDDVAGALSPARRFGDALEHELLVLNPEAALAGRVQQCAA